MAGASSYPQIDQSKINLFSVEYKVTEKLGGSLSIFAVLTARTLYTYKYEVAINNDKLHRPAFSFLSRDLLWNVTFRRVSRGPTCPAGRRTLRLLHTQVPQGTR